MKNESIELIKDLFLSILIVGCIILILSVFLYDKIAISKVIPETEDYVLTQEMQSELTEENLGEVQEVIVNYYIDATDLKKYEKTNEYNKGRGNPFDRVYSSSANDDNSSSSTNEVNNSNGFYEDDGTK